MCKCLKDQKEFINSLIGNNTNLSGILDLWEFIEGFVDSFEPVWEATLEMQSEDLNIGNFLRTWLKCEIDLLKKGTNISLELLDALKNRRTELFLNDAFCAAIFMDPRFLNFREFGDEMKKKAENHLFNTWQRICDLKNRTSVEASPIQISQSSKWSDLSIWMNGDVESVQGSTRNFSIKEKISSLKFVRPLDVGQNIFEYWETQKYESRELYDLSRVVLAVPATQVSVERAFSALALVLTKHRTRLDSDILNDILVIKNNKCLLNLLNNDNLTKQNL
jgi:hypothetical protein